MTFGAHNLFVPSHFWTPDAKFDNCCQRYIATCGKNYIGAHLDSTEVEFFLKSLSYIYDVVRTNFYADFWTFRNC